MGCAGVKRSRVSPALWVALAALSFASLSAAELNPWFKSEIMEAAWNAVSDGETYPQAAVLRVADAAEKSQYRKGASFEVMVFGGGPGGIPIEGDDRPNVTLTYLEGLQEITVAFHGEEYSINVFSEGSFQTCKAKFMDAADYFNTCDPSNCSVSCSSATGESTTCGTDQQCKTVWSPKTAKSMKPSSSGGISAPKEKPSPPAFARASAGAPPPL